MKKPKSAQVKNIEMKDGRPVLQIEGPTEQTLLSSDEITVDLNEKDFLVLALFKVIAGFKNETEDRQVVIQQLEEALHFLLNYVVSVEFIPLKKAFKYSFSCNEKAKEDEDYIRQKVKEIIEAPIVKQIIEQLIITPKRKGIGPLGTLPKQHKQSRSNMRTLAKLVGKDTKQISLFTLPLDELQEALEKQTKTDSGIPYKEKLSKKIGILSLQLLKEYQHTEKDEEGYIYIEDLGQLANELKTDTKELKYYLLYLGGYQYPSVTYYEEEKEIGLQLAKLFDIEFRYSKKYESAERKIKAEIGSETLQIIINTPIKRIRIKPSQQFIKDLEGKKGGALGYVNVNDNFIKLCLGLSDYAFKLLNYMAVNKPEYKITEDKLFKHLGLEEQVKQQRPARIREKIASAFIELKEQGHLKAYALPESGEGLYSWTYTDKYIKHQETQKKDAPALEYVNFEDKTIPVETRVKAYKDWLINTKGKKPGEAEKRAKAKYKDELDA